MINSITFGYDSESTMEITKLKYFYAVAKGEHMTRAAEELHIAQPALTKAIKLLEEELGVPLFMKNGRGIKLTIFGIHLKNKLDGILPQLNRLPEELQALKEQTKNTVRLNVLAASTAVTNAIISYKKEHPHTIFELIQNEEEGNCDISVVTHTPFVRQTGTPLREKHMTETIFLAVPKASPYASLPAVKLSDMKDEEFISLAGSRQFRAICDMLCIKAGFKLKTSFESDSIIAVQNIIGAGAGVGFWPEYSWGKMSASDMILLPISEPTCERELIVTLHAGATASPAAEDFFDHLVHFLEKKRKRTTKML